MDQRYGYLRRERTVSGPFTRASIRRQVAAEPEAAWQFSTFGDDFGDLPDWAREPAPEKEPGRTPLPLAVGRTWPDPDTWYARVLQIGSLAVLAGLLLPHISPLGSGDAEWTPLWTGITESRWSFFTFTLFLLLPVCGLIVPQLAARHGPAGRHAHRVLALLAFAVFAYGVSDRPGLAVGDWLARGLWLPPVEQRVVFDSPPMDPSSWSRIHTMLLLYGVTLIAAGTRVAHRFLSRGTPVLTVAGGLTLLAGLALPYGDQPLLVELVARHGRDELPTFNLLLAFVGLGLAVYALVGNRLTADPGTRTQSRRLLVRVLALGTPLVVCAAFAEGPFAFHEVVLGVLRDVLILGGMLAMAATSLFRWAVSWVPAQASRPPLPKPGLPRLQRMQRALAFLWLVMALGPYIGYGDAGAFDEWEPRIRWGIVELFRTLFGTTEAPGGMAFSFGNLLAPVVLAGLAYVASLLAKRRLAVSIGLTVIGIGIIYPLAGTYSQFGVLAARVVAWSPVDLGSDWSREYTDSYEAVAPWILFGLVLLLTAAWMRAHTAQRAGLRTSLQMGGALVVFLVVAAPLAGALAIVHLVHLPDEEYIYPLVLVSLCIAGLGALALIASRARANAHESPPTISRLVQPACLVLLGLATLSQIMLLSEEGGNAAVLQAVGAARYILGLGLTLILPSLWLGEALRVFAVSDAMVQKDVFD